MFPATDRSLPIAGVENNHMLFSDASLMDDPNFSQDKIYDTLKSIYPHLSDSDLRIVQQAGSEIDITNLQANLRWLMNTLCSDFQPGTSHLLSLRENAARVFKYH